MVSEPEINPDVFSWATFHRENNPGNGNEIFVCKGERGFKEGSWSGQVKSSES